MGASIGGIIGTAGGQSGTGINAPTTNAGLIVPTSNDQINGAFTENQNALAAQNNLVKALQAQNGIGNQSQVYNQLQGVVNGTGPNPAQAMLNQATGQNVANQAALMAGQRGAGANVGLLARLAAQQGAATQQQAVGQGATMQAEQSLNALNNAGNIANTQVGNQIGATTANTQARQGEQSNLLNALQGYNNAQAGLQSNVNSANAGLANTSLGNQQKFVSGALNNGAAGLATLLADGGPVSQPGPQSSFGKFLSGWAHTNPPPPQDPFQPAQPQMSSENTVEQNGEGVGSSLVNILRKLTTQSSPGGSTVAGGPMDAGLSGAAPAAMVAAQGGQVQDHRSGGPVRAASKAEKAVVKGNSYSNDKIPAVLSEGEYVLDRETLGSKSPLGEAARKLVEALKAQKHMASGGPVEHFSENGQVEQPPPSGPQAATTTTAPAPASPSPDPYSDGPDYDKQFDLQAPDNIQQAIAAPSPQQTIEQRKQEAAQAGQQDYLDEAAKWDNDLYNGHIQPKTYKDLFHDKSTLGKIGTLFGMFVSGGGSAVAGQPNALLQMMDKQIQNDLEGQIKSKENAHNFWNVSQHDLQNKVGAINNLQAAQTANLANTKGKMEQSTMHHLYLLGKNMSPADQAKWNTALQTLSPKIMQNAANYADRYGAAMATQGINPYSVHAPGQGQPNQVAPSPTQPSIPQKKSPTTTAKQYNDADLRPGSSTAPEADDAPQISVDQGKFKRSQFLGAEGVPNQITPGEVNSANDAIDEINKANLLLKEVHKQFPEMWKHAAHADTLATGLEGASLWGMHIPNPGGAFPGMKEYNTAAGAIKKQLGNLFKGGLTPEMSDLIQKQLPHANDTPDQYREKLKAIDRIIIQNLSPGVLKKYHFVKGFPE